MRRSGSSLMKSYLCLCVLLPASPALAECLQCVPDQSPRHARAKGREGDPRSARSRRHGGRKGTSGSSAWNRHCKHVDLTMIFSSRCCLLTTISVFILYFYNKQGDPGIRGPMGNPGKEGPKVGKGMFSINVIYSILQGTLLM